MENAVTGIPQRRMDREGVANLVIVTIITGAIVVILARPCGPSLAEKFRLALLFDYVFALWIAWSMPTTRVVALALVGALVGFVTECTAICTGLWIYPCYPLGVGVLIYALSAIGVFGMVYILNRILLRHAFFKTTAWLNSLIVVLIFLSLFLWAYREHDGDYLKLMVTQKWVLVYYAVLFFLAVTLAYCLRLGTLIAIIISAALVSLVGQTAGGVKAMIWLFLPDAHPAVTSPPQYLVYALWPLEYVVEFGLSAALADYLTYLFKVKEQKRAEKSLTPSLKIPFYDRRPDEDFISFLVRLNERSFAKLLRRSPETGQVFVALVGSLVAVFALFPNDTTPVDWATVIAIAALFGVALLVSPHPFWKRTVGLAVGGLVVGFGLWTATDLALLNVGPEAHFLCAPLCALLFVAIYGAAYLKTQLAARLFPCECEWNDNGEPRRSVATTVAVLTLIFVALLIWRPSFAFGATPVANGANPTLLIFLAGVPAIFLVWWFFPLVPLRRSVIQTVTAFFGSAVVVLPFCWPLESRTAWLRLLVLAGSLTIGYLFAYTGSAHVANEPLAKGIRRTYWRMRATGSQKVVFHDRSHAQGRHHELRGDELHSFPPAQSSVSVVVAERPAPTQPEPTIEATLRRTLDNLVGHWPKPGSTTEIVHTVREAVAGKKVFIKPNIVVPCGSPYTTSAELVAEVTRYCLAAGATAVHIGEIAISNITSRMSLAATGLVDYWCAVANEKPEWRNKVSVLLLDEEPIRWVTLRDADDNDIRGVVFNAFHMPAAYLEADTFYIDAPKMKTHLQSSVTLGIKNSHGAIAECDRGRRHQRIAQKVVDITKVWSPDLTIIDGYDALEGIGPWPGDLVPLRTLIASNDVVLADLVATQFMEKEELDPPPSFARPVDFAAKFVKSTWLGYEQRLGLLDPENVYRTNHEHGTANVPLTEWTAFIKKRQRWFRDPEYRDEGLIKNIGQRVGGEVDFDRPIREFDPETQQWIEWDPNREFLPLNRPNPVAPEPGPLQATSTWGSAVLVADEFRFPDLGASVMFSGVFGLMKCVLEDYFARELNVLDGFAIVYGPLRRPLECEGAILFGDGAASTEYMVFAPRIYRVEGHGKPPNNYSDVFERLAEELGGRILGFATEAITTARGWYW